MPAFANKKNKSDAKVVTNLSRGRKMKDLCVCNSSLASDGKVAPFVNKLYEMLSSPALESICGFDASGTTLQILDTYAFEEKTLPQVWCEHLCICAFLPNRH